MAKKIDFEMEFRKFDDWDVNVISRNISQLNDFVNSWLLEHGLSSSLLFKKETNKQEQNIEKNDENNSNQIMLKNREEKEVVFTNEGTKMDTNSVSSLKDFDEKVVNEKMKVAISQHDVKEESVDESDAYKVFDQMTTRPFEDENFTKKHADGYNLNRSSNITSIEVNETEITPGILHLFEQHLCINDDEMPKSNFEVENQDKIQIIGVKETLVKNKKLHSFGNNLSELDLKNFGWHLDDEIRKYSNVFQFKFNEYNSQISFSSSYGIWFVVRRFRNKLDYMGFESKIPPKPPDDNTFLSNFNARKFVNSIKVEKYDISLVTIGFEKVVASCKEWESRGEPTYHFLYKILRVQGFLLFGVVAEFVFSRIYSVGFKSRTISVGFKIRTYSEITSNTGELHNNFVSYTSSRFMISLHSYIIAHEEAFREQFVTLKIIKVEYDMVITMSIIELMQNRNVNTSTDGRSPLFKVHGSFGSNQSQVLLKWTPLWLLNLRFSVKDLLFSRTFLCSAIPNNPEICVHRYDRTEMTGIFTSIANARTTVLELLRVLSTYLQAKINVLVFASILLVIAKTSFAQVWNSSMAILTDASREIVESLTQKVERLIEKSVCTCFYYYLCTVKWFHNSSITPFDYYYLLRILWVFGSFKRCIVSTLRLLETVRIVYDGWHSGFQMHKKIMFYSSFEGNNKHKRY